MENKLHTLGTVEKSNRKIYSTDIGNINTHIHDIHFPG